MKTSSSPETFPDPDGVRVAHKEEMNRKKNSEEELFAESVCQPFVNMEKLFLLLAQMATRQLSTAVSSC